MPRGSARVSRVGERVLAIAHFLWPRTYSCNSRLKQDCFGATPKPAPGTHALLVADRRDGLQGLQAPPLLTSVRALASTGKTERAGRHQWTKGQDGKH